MDKDFKTPQSTPLANSEFEKRVLEEIGRHEQDHLNVPATDGRMLRLLTEAAGAKSVVEIGTSTGYSGLWLGLALRSTGGRLTTFDMDTTRAATAREHFSNAGVDDLIDIVEGDARANIKRLRVETLFYMEGNGLAITLKKQ